MENTQQEKKFDFSVLAGLELNGDFVLGDKIASGSQSVVFDVSKKSGGGNLLRAKKFVCKFTT